MEKLTAKSSTIFIATGDETHVFRSMEDVPPELRRQLEETTTGANAATILIADKRGREELVRALQGLPSQLHSRLASSLRNNQKRPVPVPPPPVLKRTNHARLWLEILAPILVALAVWLLTTSMA